MTEPAGLREQKKSQTRLAISRSALRLSHQKAYADITVAEIAAAAGVSRRTVSNYFSSKAECFACLADDDVVRDIVAQVIAAEGDSLRLRLGAAFAAADAQFWEDAADVHRLARTEPEVAAVVALTERQKFDGLLAQLAETGDGAIDPLRLSVTIKAIGACVGACVDHWLDEDRHGGTRSLTAMIADSLNILDLAWLDPYLGLLSSYRAQNAYPLDDRP